MKPGKEELHTIAEVVTYLQALPGATNVRTMLVEDNTFTVLVDSKGEARTIRNNRHHRWFFIDLPTKQ